MILGYLSTFKPMALQMVNVLGIQYLLKFEHYRENFSFICCFDKVPVSGVNAMRKSILLSMRASGFSIAENSLLHL